MPWSPADDIVVLLCTAPDSHAAAAIAHKLVDSRCAACVNIAPGLRSIYRWEDKVCDEPEVLMLIKVRRDQAAQVAETIRAEHPYDNPEVIALPLAGGLDAYVGWVREMTAR